MVQTSGKLQISAKYSRSMKAVDAVLLFNDPIPLGNLGNPELN